MHSSGFKSNVDPVVGQFDVRQALAGRNLATTKVCRTTLPSRINPFGPFGTSSELQTCHSTPRKFQRPRVSKGRLPQPQLKAFQITPSIPPVSLRLSRDKPCFPEPEFESAAANRMLRCRYSYP